MNGCIMDFTITMPLDLFIIFEDPAADNSWEKTLMEMTLRGMTEWSQRRPSHS